MKTTPFTEKHIMLGAKMHEFAGYNMPIEYSGIIDEHLTVCQSVGVFDVSHMGEFWVKGPHALAFLQKILPIMWRHWLRVKYNIPVFPMKREVL